MFGGAKPPDPTETSLFGRELQLVLAIDFGEQYFNAVAAPLIMHTL